MSASLSSGSSQGTNAGANQTTVYASATVTITNGYFQGLQSWGRITIGDVTYSIPGPTYMAALSDPHVAPESWYFEASRTYTHDINGYRGDVGVSASFDIDGFSSHNCSSDTADQGAVNFDRKPAAVTGTSATVNTDKSVTVSFSGGASPGGSPALTSTYHVSASQNGGAFTGDYTGSGSPITVTGLAPGNNYVFRTWATNGSNDGASASSDSSSVFVSSGGKIYNGTAWVPTTTAKIYNGTAWVDLSTAKIYNGTSWVNLT